MACRDESDYFSEEDLSMEIGSFSDADLDLSLLETLDDFKDPDFEPDTNELLSETSDSEIEDSDQFVPVGILEKPSFGEVSKSIESIPLQDLPNSYHKTDEIDSIPACKKAKKMTKTIINDQDYISDSNSEGSDIIPVQWPALSSTLSGDQGRINIIQSNVCIEEKRKPKTGCKNTYDKTNYCTFCRKSSTKISRHILTVHRDEERIRSIHFLPKRSQERMVTLELLVNEGNFKHNTEVISNGTGYLVVARRSDGMNKLDYHDFCPCEFCKKFIRKNSLWHHHRQCAVKRFFYDKQSPRDSDTPSDMNNALRRGRNLLYSVLMKNEDVHLAKLFTRMNDDELKSIVFNDAIIKRFCALRVDALGEEKDQKINDMHRVSQGARSLARLLKEVKSTCGVIKDFSDLLKPEHFDLVVKTAKKITFNSSSQPLTFARLIGNLLGHVIQVKAGMAIRENSDGKLKEAQNIQKLFESEWNCRVNAAAQKKINNLKRNTIQTIPLTNDLKILLEYVKTKMVEKIHCLQNSTNSKDWCDLAALTLCRLIMFNKRRRAEVKDLKVQDYNERPNWKDEGGEEFEQSMSTTDKIMYKRMDMVISAGKSRKNVDAYVLLPPDGKEAIEVLIKTRQEVGVPSSNLFIFARMNADTPLSGTQEMKRICEACPGLQYPERINSRNLRKYISTVCQIMDMSDKEVEQLARHLGHDTKTHKEFYRLAHSTVELSKVSQLLMAVEQGEVNKWHGKGLTEISIDEFPEFECTESQKACSSYDGDDDTMDAAEPLNQVDDIETNVAVCEAETTRTLAQCELDPKEKGHRRGKKTPWTLAESQILREKFSLYLKDTVQTLHKEDIQLIIDTMLQGRTVAQVRSKLNNMKLGKSK